MNDVVSTEPAPARGKFSRTVRRPAVVTAMVLLAVAVGAGVVFRLRAESDLAEARELIAFGDLDDAAARIDDYLKRNPSSASGHLLAAEIMVKDDRLTAEMALPAAIEHLSQIPDSDELAGRARTQEGRIYLFLLNMPGRAEQKLRRATELEPSSAEAHYLLWKLFDLTGRSFSAEEHFRETYRLTSEELRPVRLREWYMSQFYPSSASQSLNRLMESTAGYAPSGALGELQRFDRFREAEPTNPVVAALIARWYLLDGEHQEGLKLLNDALSQADSPLQDTTFVSTFISALYDLGEFEKAWSLYERWTPDDSFEYHRWTGILNEDVAGELPDALAAYDRALERWPGPADWRLMFRRANVLRRLGKIDRAEQAKVQAQRVIELMEEDVHSSLRQALAEPLKPETIDRMIEFYEELGMLNEVQCWKDMRVLGASAN